MENKNKKTVKQLKGELGEMLKEFDNLKKIVKKKSTTSSKSEKSITPKKKLKINDDFFKIGRVSESNKKTNAFIDKKIESDKIKKDKLIKKEPTDISSNFLIEFDNDELKRRDVTFEEITSKDTSDFIENDVQKNSDPEEVILENIETEIIEMTEINSTVEDTIESDTTTEVNFDSNEKSSEEKDNSYLTIKQKLELITKEIEDKEIELNQQIKKATEIEEPITSSTTKIESIKAEVIEKKDTEIVNEAIKPTKKNPLLAKSNKKSNDTTKTGLEKETQIVTKSDSVSNGLTLTILLLIIVAILVAWFTFIK